MRRRNMFTLMQVLDKNGIKYTFEQIQDMLMLIEHRKCSVWDIIDEMIRDKDEKLNPKNENKNVNILRW